tara:strand:+ start:594 stop:1667 length:1074 start_codon:yes stop_codon:yes gene_type:complete
MNIIFIASANSIHSLRWIKFFAKKKEFNINWISITKPNHETLKEFRQIRDRVNLFILFEVKNFYAIFKLLSSNVTSILHIHYLGWHSLLALLAAKNKKIILTPWGSDILIKKNLFILYWIKYLIKKSQYIICDSLRIKSRILELGAKEKKISISMFGVDTNLYKKSRTIFSSKSITIGSNRKFEKIYDINTFLEASKKLKSFSKSVKFLIAGDGSQKEEFVNYVKKNNLESSVKFLGLLNKKEMINFYNSIDIYVSTSLSDGGLSSSIAEAMSFERIVLATNNSDNNKWINHGYNGYLFENKNVDQLVKLILENIKNSQKNKNVSQNARNIILDRYSFTKEMIKVEKIYRNLIKFGY